MKNTITIFGIAAIFLSSCQQGPAKKTQAKIDSTIITNTKVELDSLTCYQYIKNRDTANLSINQKNNSVNGTLGYNLYEKDKNAGTISGMVKGDTIIADYTFQSEGQKSIREIVWLKQGDKLIEGFGDVEEINGKTKFKDFSKLTFNSSLVFSQTDCK